MHRGPDPVAGRCRDGEQVPFGWTRQIERPARVGTLEGPQERDAHAVGSDGKTDVRQVDGDADAAGFEVRLFQRPVLEKAIAPALAAPFDVERLLRRAVS